MRRRREILGEGLGRVRRRDVAVADHGVEHRLLPHLGRRPVDQGVVERRSADDAGEHRGLRQVEVLRLGVEVDPRRGGRAPGGVGEEDAVQVPLQDLVLGELALDLEREQRLADLAVERRVVADQAELHELLRDGGGALDRTVRFEVDGRGADDTLRIDARFVVEVAVLDRDHRLRQDLAHLRQGLVVSLIAGRVQVGKQRLVVGRIDQRVLGDGRRDVGRLGELVRKRDVAGRGDDEARHRDGEQRKQTQHPARRAGDHVPLAQQPRCARAQADAVGPTRPEYLVAAIQWHRPPPSTVRAVRRSAARTTRSTARSAAPGRR